MHYALESHFHDSDRGDTRLVPDARRGVGQAIFERYEELYVSVNDSLQVRRWHGLSC